MAEFKKLINPPIKASEIDSESATSGQVLTANGAGGASWQNASGGGTEVVANPSLSGTESDLTGLEVAGTKYKVPTGGSGGGVQFYKHEFETDNDTFNLITCISKTQTQYNSIENLRDDMSNIIQIYLPFYGTAIMSLSSVSAAVNFLCASRSNETNGTTTFTINSITNDYVTSL